MKKAITATAAIIMMAIAGYGSDVHATPANLNLRGAQTVIQSDSAVTRVDYYWSHGRRYWRPPPPAYRPPPRHYRRPPAYHGRPPYYGRYWHRRWYGNRWHYW
jgi:hypothetical protein